MRLHQALNIPSKTSKPPSNTPQALSDSLRILSHYLAQHVETKYPSRLDTIYASDINRSVGKTIRDIKDDPLYWLMTDEAFRADIDDLENMVLEWYFDGKWQEAERVRFAGIVNALLEEQGSSRTGRLR